MPKFLIEAISQYRMVYCIEADSKEAAVEYYEANPTMDEFGQDWLGEMTLSSREVSDDECIRVFDEINPYLKYIDPERKLSYIVKKGSSE